ncbi:MAG TPA: NAD(P)H-hydrate epimerase [Nitrososphaeraceae archaeon]
MSSKVITSEQMYMIEENGHSLFGMSRMFMMENAGHGVADFIVDKLGSKLRGKSVVAVCGTGNNGGDAFVASRHLAGHGLTNMSIVLLGFPRDIRTQEAKTNWQIVNKMNSIKVITPSSSRQNKFTELMEKKIEEADIILDGLVGTGIRGKIRQPYASAIDVINRSNSYVLSIDIPSGLDPNNGRVIDKCIKANVTVTFHRMKKGLLKAKKYTGTVYVEKIGIPPEAENGVLN